MILVSVVMSVYNEKEEELSQAIDSILSQTYENIEFVIVSDNPNNNKLNKLLLKYKELDNRVILLMNDKNIGLAKSLNKAISKSSGEFIARMDADDVSHLDRISSQVEYLCDNSKISVVSSNCIYIDEQDKEIGRKGTIPTCPDEIKKLLPVGSSIIHPSVMIRKNALIETGLYREFRMAEDYDLWLRMISKSFLIGSIDKPLIKYRIRESSMTQSDVFLKVLMDKYIISLHEERKLHSIDSFSNKDLEDFLFKNKYYDIDYKDRFNNMAKEFNKVIGNLREKKLGKNNLFKVFFFYTKEEDYRFMINRFIKYQYLVRKLKKE